MLKVLSGLRVVEMGTFITGPAAAMFLGDLGAEVIKVERPDVGDPFRSYQGTLYAPHFQTYNRNKRSITLDTEKPDDLEIFYQLIASADVFIQNFRPGVAEKLGVGEAKLRQLNPRLVYCAISGFGKTGPAKNRPGYDSVSQAASGFIRLLISPENPRVVGPAIGDAVTGLFTAMGALGAIVERGRTGVGRTLDVSMLEAMCYFNLDAFTHYLSAGEVMGPYSRPSVSQSYVFECSDGKWVAMHMSSPAKFWQGLAAAIERPDLFSDPHFADRDSRIKYQTEIIAYLTPIFKALPRDEWCRRLEANEVPHSPVYATDDALDDPQAKHLKIRIESNRADAPKFTTVRPPYMFDGRAADDVRPPPHLGEHNGEIRQELARARSDQAASDK